MMELGIGVVIFLAFLIILAVIIGILAFVFWILMLIDSAQRNFKNENDRIVWVLIIIFVGIIGALIYYFVVKNKDKKGKKRQ